jgi:hypothetical protein
MLFVYLDIGTEFELTMFTVVELEPSDNAVRAHGLGDAISGWKHV